LILSVPVCRGVPSKQEGLAATRAGLFAGEKFVAGEECLDTALSSGCHDGGFHELLVASTTKYRFLNRLYIVL
jgi:hypothetical protein